MARPPARPGKPKPLGNHQSSWVWGRHLVTETLQAGRWPILELWLADDVPQAEIDSLAPWIERANLPLKRTPRASLHTRCRGEDHQGYAALMGEYPYASLSDCTRANHSWPLLVGLDRIQDPFNFGTMLRSSEIFAAQGVLIGKREQVGVTSQVARSSVGAVNRLPICQVDDLARSLNSADLGDFTIVAASEKASTLIDDFDFRRPTLVVIGNEGKGISPEVAACCSHMVRIPQPGQINSLNAAAALAIFCYEIRRQQK